MPMRRVLRGDGGGGVVADVTKAPPVDPVALDLAAEALRGGQRGAEEQIIF